MAAEPLHLRRLARSHGSARLHSGDETRELSHPVTTLEGEYGRETSRLLRVGHLRRESGPLRAVHFSRHKWPTLTYQEQLSDLARTGQYWEFQNATLCFVVLNDCAHPEFTTHGNRLLACFTGEIQLSTCMCYKMTLPLQGYLAHTKLPPPRTLQ